MPSTSSEPTTWGSADIVHGALRGTVAAMSVGGLRVLSTSLGLLEKTPPEMITSEQAPNLVRNLSDEARDSFIVLLHWGYGAMGGALFGALPARIRRRPGAGPAFGLALWLAFELGLSPALGLQPARRRSTGERLALAADHLLYGAVLSELRSAPQR